MDKGNILVHSKRIIGRVVKVSKAHRNIMDMEPSFIYKQYSLLVLQAWMRRDVRSAIGVDGVYWTTGVFCACCATSWLVLHERAVRERAVRACCYVLLYLGVVHVAVSSRDFLVVVVSIAAWLPYSILSSPDWGCKKIALNDIAARYDMFYFYERYFRR